MLSLSFSIFMCLFVCLWQSLCSLDCLRIYYVHQAGLKIAEISFFCLLGVGIPGWDYWLITLPRPHLFHTNESRGKYSLCRLNNLCWQRWGSYSRGGSRYVTLWQSLGYFLSVPIFPMYVLNTFELFPFVPKANLLPGNSIHIRMIINTT